jgi:hypothetical protein
MYDSFYATSVLYTTAVGDPRLAAQRLRPKAQPVTVWITAQITVHNTTISASAVEQCRDYRRIEQALETP